MFLTPSQRGAHPAWGIPGGAGGRGTDGNNSPAQRRRVPICTNLGLIGRPMSDTETCEKDLDDDGGDAVVKRARHNQTERRRVKQLNAMYVPTGRLHALHTSVDSR